PPSDPHGRHLRGRHSLRPTDATSLALPAGGGPGPGPNPLDSGGRSCPAPRSTDRGAATVRARNCYRLGFGGRAAAASGPGRRGARPGGGWPPTTRPPLSRHLDEQDGGSHPNGRRCLRLLPRPGGGFAGPADLLLPSIWFL
ncbi:unnamed protein product, partial [Urochloa humidicola]